MFPHEQTNVVEDVKDRYGSVNDEEIGVGDLDHIIQHNESIVERRRPGLKIWMATILIAGEMVGGGILSLPKAVDESGVFGFIMVLLFGAFACYSGTMLGKCWLILTERWPEYNEHIRDPYPAIALRAFGPVLKIITKVSVDVTLFGTATVFLLIGSQLTQSLVQTTAKVDFSYCYWVLIFGACLAPVMWLGSPKDFWPIGILALGATALTVVISVISMIKHKHNHIEEYKHLEHTKVTTEGVFLAFGTILFMYGGASTFPTIQNDMRDKKKFVKSVLVGFSVILSLYMPIAFTSYFVFGSAIKPNLLASLDAGRMKQACEGLIIAHLLMAFFVVVNPLCQDMEKLLRIPNRFGVKRVAFRAAVMVCIIFVAESVPHFTYILNVIGGSSVTLLTFVFPCLFFLQLTRMKAPNGEKWPIWTVPLWEKILLVTIMVIGVIGGSLSTYNAFKKIVSPKSFILPCYVDLKAASTG